MGLRIFFQNESYWNTNIAPQSMRMKIYIILKFSTPWQFPRPRMKKYARQNFTNLQIQHFIQIYHAQNLDDKIQIVIFHPKHIFLCAFFLSSEVFVPFLLHNQRIVRAP